MATIHELQSVATESVERASLYVPDNTPDGSQHPAQKAFRVQCANFKATVAHCVHLEMASRHHSKQARTAYMHVQSLHNHPALAHRTTLSTLPVKDGAQAAGRLP